jgi:hypothetical protein
VHAVRDEYAQHTTLDDRQPVTALTKNEGEPTPGAHVCSVGEKWASLKASWVFGSKLGHGLGYM